jgi:hypothetical protein
VKRLKDILAMESDGSIEEIVESDVRAVAAVDRPATDRRWRFFKADGIPPQLAPLPNQTACLAEDDQPTPTTCAADAATAPLMVPDFAGHEGKVTSFTKAIAKAIEDGVLGKAVPEDRDRDTYERCIDKVMEQGHDKSSAFAICTAGGAGKEVSPMKQAKCPTPGVKDDVADAVPPPDAAELDAAVAEMEAEPETIEIPATPTEWLLGDCVNQAVEANMSNEQAVQACGIVYADYGDPGDETKILVPEGNTPEGLLNAAATKMGLTAKFQGSHKAVKFTGRNRWRAMFNRFLGRPSARPEAQVVEYLKGLESQMEGVMAEQTKSRDDLRYVVDRMLAQQSQTMATIAALAGVPIPAPAPEPEAEPATSGPLTFPGADGKVAPSPVAGAKDGAAAGAPMVPPQQGTEERLAALEQMLQQLMAAVGGGGEVPDPEGEEEMEAPPPLPNKRISLPAANPANRLQLGAKSVAAGRGGTQYSSMYGVSFSAAERAAAVNNSTGLQSIGRK